ncbi:hypothetical protein LJ737_18365 [Hymenobacter sp. 15J16-1T3B]|uniref:hypothetical protein n=1 Tax=Hymenobacter sp. 15J16-1T3B TaxID=2886941 RepID=UPI001D100616|nr:hypothetical protein [Hymenobacter sp. 15J16-1T3B]MCC3159212.1 hypothetical protein [Hymenobacter sp. 15J16-1T3B]
MTSADFAATLTAPAPPAQLPPLLRALWLEHHGHWDAAHDLAQQDETDRLACWLHAYLHRREGDLANAGYWYRRAGRARFAGSEAEEWQALVQAALPKE